MSEESDIETSELDIGSKSFNGLKEKMKILGFQDGVAKGRDVSFQEGFDMGYSAGFKLGENLGTTRGRMRCQAELGESVEKEIFDKRKVDSLAIEGCIMCQNQKKNNEQIDNSNKIHSETFEIVALMQQKYIDDVINSSKVQNNL